MKVSTLLTGIAILFLVTNFASGTAPRASAEDELWLSPVNTGDCVAPRIATQKTQFVAQLDEKYCIENNADEAKARTCIENSRAQQDFSFFTDRCSEKEYFIGINGKEVSLRRVSKGPGKPHDFMGSFSGEGYSVEINNPVQVGEITRDGDNEDGVVSGAYKVDIVVRHKAIRKTFKGILSYGL
ncbi:MAG TPA: hypothetical protein VJV03_09195 [Pyrinomonadaceae bacterium]|nr:hypothetical protein [Pyrinomonadaceae bacterium]